MNGIDGIWGFKTQQWTCKWIQEGILTFETNGTETCDYCDLK